MIALDQSPLPERDLPSARRAAIRDLLVAHATAAAPVRAPLVTRRRLAFATASLAGVAAAIPLLATSDGGDVMDPLPGYAAWSPFPASVDAAAAEEFGRGCRAFMLERPTPVPDLPVDGWDRMLVDQRGDTAIVLLAHSSEADALSCAYRDVDQPSSNRQPVAGVVVHYDPMAGGDGLLPVETGYTISADHTVIGYSYGQVGSEVARATITLVNGTELEASMSDGWYLAWWPAYADGQGNIDLRAGTITAYDAGGAIVAQHAAHHGP